MTKNHTFIFLLPPKIEKETATCNRDINPHKISNNNTNVMVGKLQAFDNIKRVSVTESSFNIIQFWSNYKDSELHELAKIFAQHNHSIIAIARTPEKLDMLAASIPNELLQNVTTTVYDVVKDPFSKLQKVIETLEWDSVDILINNAGLLINKPFRSIR